MSWSNVAWSQSWPYFEEEVGLEISWGPFQPELALDSKTMKMNESQGKDAVGRQDGLLHCFPHCCS